jgi:glutaconate CoA-transferase subunit A
LADAERRLRDVRSVALGGMLLENRPSTLVRALLRSGAAGLFLCSAPAASWDADVLLGARRVSRVRIPHISFASLGLAPATRRAAAAGTVVFEDCDEAILLGGYLAASGNVPIQVLHNLGTNDLVDGNPLLIRSGDLVGVGPLRVDVALLHAPLGDEKGNLRQPLGRPAHRQVRATRHRPGRSRRPDRRGGPDGRVNPRLPGR